MNGGWTNGKILFIEGENKGRYPHSNSMLINDDVSVLVDTGIGETLAKKIAREKRVDYIINSHGHEDHIAGNNVFKDAKVCSHKLDAPVIRSVDKLAQLYAPRGTEEEMTVNWYLKEHFRLEDSQVDLEFGNGHVFNLGSVQLEVIHTPGHSRGHCCFCIPSEKLVFLADIDLSSFGPWYGGLDCNLDQFIESIKKITHREFKTAITSHKGVIEGRNTIKNKLNDYLDKIFGREEELLNYLEEERRMDEIIERAIIYGRFPQPKDLYRLAERIMIEKHLNRLIRDDLVQRTEVGFKAIQGAQK